MKKKALVTISSLFLIFSLLLVGCGTASSVVTPTPYPDPGKKDLYRSARRYCNQCGVIWTCHSSGFGDRHFPDGWARWGCLCPGE